MSSSFVVTPDRALPTSYVDPELRFDRFPSDFAIKGMFLTRMASLATPRVWEDVRPRLVKAPPLGRYLPFSDYPQVDYSRLAHAVARDLQPLVPVTEAMRRLARKDLETFADSQLGKVMLSFAGDPVAVLLKLPEMYRAALRGGTVGAERLGASAIVLEFRDFYGWLDCYPIGTIEGVVARYSARCEITVALDGDLHGTFTVRLD